MSGKKAATGNKTAFVVNSLEAFPIRAETAMACDNNEFRSRWSLGNFGSGIKVNPMLGQCIGKTCFDGYKCLPTLLLL